MSSLAEEILGAFHTIPLFRSSEKQNVGHPGVVSRWACKFQIEVCVVSAERCLDKLLPLKQVSYREAVSRSDEKQTISCADSRRLCFEPVCARSTNIWTVARRKKTEPTVRYERQQYAQKTLCKTRNWHDSTANTKLRHRNQRCRNFRNKDIEKVRRCSIFKSHFAVAAASSRPSP